MNNAKSFYFMIEKKLLKIVCAFRAEIQNELKLVPN
jgi:hypothetical protein